MEAMIGWILAILGQVGVFYLMFRFLRLTQRRDLWFGLLVLPLLAILWFGYELFQHAQNHLISAFLAAGVSILSFGLLWFLLPSTKEAFTQYDRIRAEKDEYQLLLDQLPDPVVLKDLTLNYRKVNSSFAQIIGKAIDLLIGRSDADFFPPKIAQTLEEDEKRAIESKQPVTRRIELITVKGKRWFDLTFTPLMDKLGMTIGVLVNGHDLTDLIERTQTLESDLHLRNVLGDAVRKMFACDSEAQLWDVTLELMEEIGETPYVALAIASEDGESFVIEGARKAEAFQIGKSIRSIGSLFGKIPQSDQFQIYEDFSSWREAVQGEEGEGLQWAIGVPIHLDGRVRGVVALFYKQPEKEVVERRKEILINGARIAELILKDLYYKRAMEQRLAQARKELEQTSLRQRVDHFLTALAVRLVNAAPHQIDTLLEKAVGSFAEYVGAEKSYVYLFKKEEGGLQARYRWSRSHRLLPPTEIPEPFDIGISWLLERINRQEIVSLSRLGEMPEALGVYFDVQEIDFLVAVPIVLRRTVVGYLGLEGKEEGGVIFDQIGAVKAMADLVINALDRKWSSDELEERIKILSEKMSQLELHNQRNKMLTEMGDLLQSCRTADEAYPIVARYAQILMPHSVGALYLLRSLQDVAEKVAFWGNEPSGENELVLNECWGIRRGKVHLARDAEGPLCNHLGTPLPQRYICVPLIAQGETIGLLHIRGTREEANDDDHLEEMSKIGVSIAEHVAPALSNLNLRDKLRSQAIRDPLTGLFNRRYMEETLDREIRRAARHKYSVGLIMCDIDQMKPINDRYGHDAGDVVLRQIGGLMKKIFRGEDVACRYGGDEFMVILPEASLSDVWQRAENLRETVKKTQFEYEGKPIGPVTVSIGVAAYPDLGSTVERLIQVSDAAAYLAKHEGGDRVMIAHHTDDNSK